MTVRPRCLASQHCVEPIEQHTRTLLARACVIITVKEGSLCSDDQPCTRTVRHKLNRRQRDGYMRVVLASQEMHGTKSAEPAEEQ
jgi:hypothetical protein